jgi:peptidoglycan/LPS O-acetylase OafA/YrhL
MTIVALAYEVARQLGDNTYLVHGDYVMLVPVALLLVVAAGTDLRGRSGILTRPLSVYLGEISFAFYLVHWLVIALVLDMQGWGGQPWGTVRGVEPFAVMFVGSLLAAIALHHVVELPMQRLLRGPGASIATADPLLVAEVDTTRLVEPITE